METPILLALASYTVAGLWWGGNLNAKVNNIALIINDIKATLKSGEFMHCREHRQMISNLSHRMTLVERRLDGNGSNGRCSTDV
jgi:hypothetical protein